MDVDAMLASMTWEQLQEWQAFSELEPFGEERADYRSAQVSQALWNIARDQKAHPKGWPIDEFLLRFGDAPQPEPAVQSVEYQERLISDWCFVNNEVLKCQQTSA